MVLEAERAGYTIGTAPAPGPPPPAPAPAARRGAVGAVVFGTVVTALVVGGALLRVWILGHDAMNADEAVVGLVARGILDGHLTAFVWHQGYGGVEPYLVAAMFTAFGSSPFVLNLTPALLAAGVAVVTWRIGRHLFSNWAGLAAGALAWVWPESAVFNSTREYGYHEAALLAGVVVLLETVRIARRRPSRDRATRWSVGAALSTDDGATARRGVGRILLEWSLPDWALLGLAAGAGWWASPEIAYFVIPAAAVLLVTCCRRARAAVGAGVSTAALFCFVGVLPWIVAGVDDKWATISSVRPSRHTHSYWFRLHIVFSHVLPLLYGLQVEGRGLWEGGRSVGPVLYDLALAVSVAAMAVVAVRFAAARLLVVCCGVFPFVYAAFPTSWFWQDGRYGVFLAPLLALLLVGAVSAIERPWGRARVRDRGAPVAGWRRVVARSAVYVLLAAAVTSTAVAVVTSFQLMAEGARTAPWRATLSPDVTALARRLEHDGVHDAYTDYWVAYDLQFLSGGAITTFPIAQDKNPAMGRQVTLAPRAAWIFVLPTPASQSTAEAQLGAGGDLEPPGVTEAPLAAWMRAHHVAYSVTVVRPFSVVIPDRNVTPADIDAPGTELG